MVCMLTNRYILLGAFRSLLYWFTKDAELLAFFVYSLALKYIMCSRFTTI